MGSKLTNNKDIEEYEQLMHIWDCLKDLLPRMVMDKLKEKCGIPYFMAHMEKTTERLDILRKKMPRTVVQFFRIFRDVIDDAMQEGVTNTIHWDEKTGGFVEGNPV